MWTDEQRKTYRRPGGGYPSDVSESEWSVLGALIPDATPGRRPRKTDMRSAMNAILYLLRTGCPWRYLPRDGFPPRSTVYNIFRKFQADGTWHSIWDQLYPIPRASRIATERRFYSRSSSPASPGWTASSPITVTMHSRPTRPRVPMSCGSRYLPTGWREATGAGAIAARYNEVLRGLLKADSLAA